MRLFKVFSCTDGIHTIYSVSRQMTERSASIQLENPDNVIEETILFSDADIISMNKMSCLKVKTGNSSDDVLEAIRKTLESMSEQDVNDFLNHDNESKPIIEKWLNN